METSFQKTIALLIALGSILFIIAAFLPYSRVFGVSNPEKKLAIILDMRTVWTVGQILFGLGSLITVSALGLQSYGLRKFPGAIWSHLGVILMFVGVIFWCWLLWERSVDPEAFTKEMNRPYFFLLYSFLTQFGLALIGTLVLKSGIMNWVGWMLIIGSAAFFLLMVIFKDMPPFVYYVLTLIAAVAIFLQAG